MARRPASIKGTAAYHGSGHSWRQLETGTRWEQGEDDKLTQNMCVRIYTLMEMLIKSLIGRARPIVKIVHLLHPQQSAAGDSLIVS
jgi:hypothetical protein